MSLIKVLGIGCVGLCAVICVKNLFPSFSGLISVATGLVIFGICFLDIEEFVSYYYSLSRSVGYGEYFAVMLKGLGVAFLTQLGSELCRDNGEELLASRIEFAGKLEILVIALPLVKSLVELSKNILIE